MNEGSILYVDDADQVTGMTDVTVRLQQAREHYQREGLDPALIESIVR